MKKDRLHNITSTGFKTPNAYFESFDDKLFERIDKKESIDGVETSGYIVPVDYFNTVEESILSKLNIEDKPVINIKPGNNFYFIAGIAASLVLFLALFVNNGQTEEVFTAEMVETYFENSDLDSYELAELLSDADLLEDDFTIVEATYNEGNLESYLLDNADIETILE